MEGPKTSQQMGQKVVLKFDFVIVNYDKRTFLVIDTAIIRIS